LELLATLIDSTALAGTLDLPAGMANSSSVACAHLGLQADRINGKLAELARAGNRLALGHVWSGGAVCAEALHDIAMQNPQSLGPLARNSLFFPSLRARSKTFQHDFPRLAAAIGLSDDCIVNMGPNALHQLDKPGTRFVAELLQRIARERQFVLQTEQTMLKFIHAAHDRPGGEFARYAGFTLADWLQEHFPASLGMLAYRDLPPFDADTVGVWWKQAVKPYLEEPSTLEKLKGTPFYEELRKATSSGKDYEILDELKRRCKDKLKPLAKPA
jgi:hypothetical protein